jgi:hypothetical protein
VVRDTEPMKASDQPQEFRAIVEESTDHLFRVLIQTPDHAVGTHLPVGEPLGPYSTEEEACEVARSLMKGSNQQRRRIVFLDDTEEE